MSKAISKGLTFDGFGSEGYSRKANKYAKNQWSGHSNDGRLVNFGRGPTEGNKDHAAKKVGPPATKDAYRAVPMCHNPKPSPGKEMFTGHSQVRNPGGTRAWDPKRGQNYNGNPDRINIQAKGSNGMGESSARNPVAIAKRAGDPDTINYGPKKQY